MSDMYNKLFTKILDSSIWLEPTPTRIVWLTFIAVMDEDGFVAFAAPANVAHRARVELPEAEVAIAALEAPDENSSDPDHDGRRIERVPGGWIVLNAAKYRALTTRVIIQEQTRKRVARHRAKLKGLPIDECNASVTQANAPVTPSVAVTEAITEGEKNAPTFEEKILWEGKRYWLSQAFKQLALLDKELVGKEGLERKSLNAKRSSLLIALGARVPKSTTPKLTVVKPAPPMPTPEEAQRGVEAMRRALEGV